MTPLRSTVLALAVLALACEKTDTASSTPPGSSPAATDSTPAAAPAPAPVTFGEMAPAIGMQRQKQQAMLMTITMQVEVGGKQITLPFTSADVEQRREEILALDGNKVTKLRVTYEAAESRKKDSDGEKVEPSPVAGKRYIVAFDGGKVTVARDGKGKLPKAEREVVEKDYRRLGQDNEVCNRLREKPPVVGDTVQLSGEEFSAMTSGEGGLTLTLREVLQRDGRDWAAFDAKLSMQGPIDDGEIKIDLAGVLMVDVQTCSGDAFEGEGPLSMTASTKAKDGTPLSMKGTGSAKFSSAESLWQAK